MGCPSPNDLYVYLRLWRHHFSLILFPLINGHSTGSVKKKKKKQSKNKTENPKKFLHKARTGEHPQRAAPWSFSSLFPPLSLKVLAMNSGQVWLINRLWGERGQGRPGAGKDKLPPTRTGSRRALYRRKDSQEGHCLQGALWSHTAYKKYLHAFATLGPGALSCQLGT